MRWLFFILWFECLCFCGLFANNSSFYRIEQTSKVRTFVLNGKSVTVDVQITVRDYYLESLSGRWNCIPAVVECGAKEYAIPEAQYLLGISYIQGINRDRNIDIGMEWLKKAADQNLVEAMSELGSYYTDFGKYDLAEKYLIMASRIPANLAYYNLGYLYHMKGDMQLAEKYYRLAIERGPKGQVDAIHNLNILLVNQYRVADTIPILRLGVDKFNDSYCMGTLGCLFYYLGAALDNNPSLNDKKKGIELLKKGAALGDSRSIQTLDEINKK